MNVYQAINAIQADLAVSGISKDRKNEQQGYKFRGIDDMYNAIAPLLAKHRLLILPAYSERSVTERTTAKGTALFYVNLAGTFTLISAEDGSQHVVGPFYGEAMDSGDKATNKAQSAAFKYMAMQTFCIPTEGDNDADATTHEVTAEPVSKPLSTGVFAKHKNAISNAATELELRKAFTAAFVEAKAAGDGHAASLFTDLKDQRKAELETMGETA
jgi:hypothetical protein